MKFSKGILSILIMLMKLFNTSSAFSAYVAGILVLSDISSVLEGPYLRNGTEDFYERLDPLLNLGPAETFLHKYR